MNDPFYGGSPLGLNILISQDRDIGSYFLSLPEEIREQINLRADEIHSAEDLHQLADQYTDWQ